MKTDVLPKPIQKALSDEKVFLDALFKRPKSLGALLPLQDFLDEHGVYQNKDGSLGIVYAVELVEHETLRPDQILEKVSTLKTWFQLPESCALQILYDQANVSSRDGLFTKFENKTKEAHPVSKFFYERDVNTLKQACESSDQERRPLKRSLYVSLRYFTKNRKPFFLKDFAEREEALLSREMKEFVSELKVFQSIIANFEVSSGLALKRVLPEELTSLLRSTFNPVSFYRRGFARYNKDLSLSDQIIYSAPLLSHEGVTLEGRKSRTLSLKTSPKYVYPGGTAYFSTLNFPFKLSLNFSFPTKGKVKQFFDLKEFFLQNTPSAKAKRQREEVLSVQDSLARGDRCLHMTFNIIIDGETEEELDVRTRQIVNIFNNRLEAEVVVEKDIGLGLLLNSLPLFYTPKADLSTQRAIRILRSDVVNFIPIFDSFRGMSNPLMLLMSRENNIAPFSQFENATSNHTAVLADTGSGKSAFVANCIFAAKLMSPEPFVFIVDKKSSYKGIAKLFNADMTTFDWNADISFSPFRGTYSERKFAFLTHFICACIAEMSKTFVIEPEHRAAITRALKKAYEKKVAQSGLEYRDGKLVKLEGAPETFLTMEDFISELATLPAEKDFEHMGDMTTEIASKLKPFYGDGSYAPFFRGKETPEKKSNYFYIYDLDALESDPTLMTLVAMSVFGEIVEKINLPENQGRGGLVIVEEVGRIGQNPVAASFIETAAETMRKQGVCLVPIFPRPQNIFEMAAGRAAWGAADNFVFLQMSDDNIRYVSEKSEIFDEPAVQIVKSLRLVKDKYTEFYFTNKKKSIAGAYRIYQDDMKKWVCGANSKDTVLLEDALKRSKGDIWKTLEDLAGSNNIERKVSS